MSNSNNVVLVEEYLTASGHKIGSLVLNKPKALNALDLDMASIMLEALHGWSNNDEIVCVVISSQGDKAFCAGGDIVSMYNAMKASNGTIPPFLEAFFTTEYTLDYTIHNFSKPIIVWGSGIVMGGGMGLLCGASHRIVTETSRLAMPEITIGLYPDVGGSYFLPRLPGKSGLFLGLTGGNMNGADAMYVGLADALVDSSQFDDLLTKLKAHVWSEVNTSEQVTAVISELSSPVNPPPSNVKVHQEYIDGLCVGETCAEVVSAILAADMQGDKWLSRAQKTLSVGSPITAHLVFEQCQRGAELSLADCFKMEAIMSCRCGESGEFQEGVRALLIDKDNSPKWQYSSVADVPAEVITNYFSSPWSDETHPLKDLGA